MSWHKVFAVFRKELLDCIRDKRTVISVIVLPLVLYPLIMIGFNSMMSRQQHKLESKTTVYYLNDIAADENSQMIADSLSQVRNFQKYNLKDDPKELIKKGEVHIAVTIARDSLTFHDYPVYNVAMLYDGSNDRSQLALDKMKAVMGRLDKELIRQRLARIGLSAGLLDAVDTQPANIADPQRMLGFFIGKFLPYFVILLCFSAGMVIASDLVAGEKERKTLETLLVSGAGRNDIVFGKYLTVIAFSFVTVVLNLFSVYFSFKQVLGQDINTSAIQLPFTNFLLIFLAMIPFVSLVAGVLLAVSTYSRNMKEAQSYLSPLMIAAMMLSFVPMLPGVQMTAGFALIPIVNIALLFKEIMMNQFNLLHFGLVVGSTLLLDVLAVILMVRMFNQEATLFRVEDEKSLKFWGKDRKNALTPGFAVAIFTLLLLLLYYVGGTWQRQNIVSGLMQTEVILVFLPAYVALRLSKVNIGEAIRLQLPRLSSVIYVILLSIPAFILANKCLDLVDFIYPIPADYLKKMGDAVSLGNSDLKTRLLLIGLLPAICEEFLFRGYFMRVFRNKGFWPAIIITAFMFGIYHLDPFRGLPVTLLGIWLGFIMLRSDSILISMLAHFLNNAMSVLIGDYAGKIPETWHIFNHGRFSWAITGVALVAFVGLLMLYLRSTKRPPELVE